MKLQSLLWGTLTLALAACGGAEVDDTSSPESAPAGDQEVSAQYCLPPSACVTERYCEACPEGGVRLVTVRESGCTCDKLSIYYGACGSTCTP